MSKAYRSNLTWEQWELISDLFPEEKPGNRPRKLTLFTVVNAILYVLCVRVASRREGCTWRGLPGDSPAWSTVYRNLLEMG
ncbi:transposase [Nostoc sp. CHAB 5824]|nr:transposase [Nostoc sp. CHAB 5824]